VDDGVEAVQVGDGDVPHVTVELRQPFGRLAEIAAAVVEGVEPGDLVPRGRDERRERRPM
jgi:hypothetical protein